MGHEVWGRIRAFAIILWERRGWTTLSLTLTLTLTLAPTLPLALT